MITNNYIWHGVVENNNDPLKLGRVKVRVFGEHSVELNDAGGLINIESDDLPWAQVAISPNNASMNGIGHSHNGILQGSWVLGFYRDDLKQEPIVFSVLTGFSNVPNSQFKTFRDPDGVYPKKDFCDEQDTNRLARNDFNDDMNVVESLPDVEQYEPEKDYTPTHARKVRHTILKNKLDSMTKDIKLPTFELKGENPIYDEPFQSYNTTYPFNQVFETECGHIKEYDSTPGNERIHEYHKSGTFDEIRPDGSKITKIVGDDYEIVIKDKQVSIGGNLNITIMGDANMLVEGNVLQQVKGNVKQNIEGEAHVKVEKDVKVETNGNAHVDVKGDTLIETDGNATVNVAKNAIIDIKGTTQINSTGTITVDTKANANVKASGNITVDASANMDLKCTTFNMSASGTASLIAGGLMTIDGSMVSIG